MSEATNRRQLLADAAIATLANAGLRGLTHRAVDRTAGLPEGSCSYYFRTRQALLRAAADRLAEADSDDVITRTSPHSPADLAEIAETAAELIEHWLVAGRIRMLARYELALESTRQPELRAVLTEAGRQIRQLAETLLTAAGAPDPSKQAPVLVACVDGIVFDHLAGAGALALSPGELRATLLALLRTFTRDE